jgi:tetratricopeptide (TPR) repeat protein
MLALPDSKMSLASGGKLPAVTTIACCDSGSLSLARHLLHARPASFCCYNEGRMARLLGLLVVSVVLALPASSQTIVVFPFENTEGTARTNWLEQGLAELTIQRLSGGSRLVLTREDWTAAMEKLGLPAGPMFAGYSRATMLKLGQHVHADFVVFGSFSMADGILHIVARALRIEPPALLAPVEAIGRLADFMDLHASLVADLLVGMGELDAAAREGFLKHLPRLRLDAFENYARGLQSTDVEQRLRLLREAARQEPNWSDPAYALGQTYFAQRDLASALIWLSRVPPAHERGFEAAFYAGVCHLLRNDLARSLTTYSSLVAAAQASDRSAVPEVLNNLGVVLARRQNWPQAINYWREATELAATEPTYWYNLGLAEMFAGRFTEAAAMFREVLLLNPDDAQARALLVQALKRGGRPEEARAEREAVEFELPKMDDAPAALLRVKTQLDSPRQEFVLPLVPALALPERTSGKRQGAVPAAGGPG